MAGPSAGLRRGAVPGSPGQRGDGSRQAVPTHPPFAGRGAPAAPSGAQVPGHRLCRWHVRGAHLPGDGPRRGLGADGDLRADRHAPRVGDPQSPGRLVPAGGRARVVRGGPDDQRAAPGSRAGPAPAGAVFGLAGRCSAPGRMDPAAVRRSPRPVPDARVPRSDGRGGRAPSDPDGCPSETLVRVRCLGTWGDDGIRRRPALRAGPEPVPVEAGPADPDLPARPDGSASSGRRRGPGSVGFGLMASPTDEEVRRMAREIDWQLFEKAVDVTASALRGAMGGESSQPPQYAGDVFRAVWEALKDAAADLPDKPRPGFAAAEKA